QRLVEVEVLDRADHPGQRAGELVLTFGEPLTEDRDQPPNLGVTRPVVGAQRTHRPMMPTIPAERKALRAAKCPHMPVHPAPGGVAAEHRHAPATPVEYGLRPMRGRKISSRGVLAPVTLSPPT